MRDNRHPPFAERYAEGKALRRNVPRESLGDFTPPQRDPLALIDETNRGRLRSLLPVRRERMSESPFAFLRGAAVLMANDLASATKPGILVQSCGDCHLMNFGAFLSPEANVLFDINDFDETLPGVDFTVDVKRLAASFAVAALHADMSDKSARKIAKSVGAAYRTHMAALARMSPLDAWQSRIRLTPAVDEIFSGAIAEKLHKLVVDAHEKRNRSDNHPQEVLDKTTGKWRIVDKPPNIYHVETGPNSESGVDIPKVFDACRDTLLPEVAALLSRYQLQDTAFKVVGVGSVGTFCAIGLFMTSDAEPLYLQIKEAQTSVLERLAGHGWMGQQGARVVTGQRIMQAASDLFLGWMIDPASGRKFYVRHLKNRRLGAVSELLEEEALPKYAVLCGRTLARAHARSGVRGLITGYMGKTEVFDDAIASFAMLYARQNKKDFELFIDAPAPAA